MIGNGDAVVLPYGRTRIDWEVELATVIGRAAKYVTADEAEDHIFGYMVSLDISDRGGRPPGGNPLQSDWFVGKGHDTFLPTGPWIVPKEFYGNPMEILRQTLSIDGTSMQEATGGDMIHSLWELVEYASSIVTLFPGDVINNGTSGGTGAGTAVRGVQRFLQPGEEIVASIDGSAPCGCPSCRKRRPNQAVAPACPRSVPIGISRHQAAGWNNPAGIGWLLETARPLNHCGPMCLIKQRHRGSTRDGRAAFSNDMLFQ